MNWLPLKHLALFLNALPANFPLFKKRIEFPPLQRASIYI